MARAQGTTGPDRAVRAAAVAERAEATRAALIEAARTLFVEQGFHATGIEQIVTAAGVGTRGALYHHFEDKKSLFRAVIEAVEQDLMSASATRVRPGTAFAQLRAGLLGFLDASVTAEVQRVLLIDGPAVLGWQEWREVEQRFGLGAIRTLLDNAIADGSLPRQPTATLTHVLLAAVDEAALFIANSPDPAAARDEAVLVVDRLLDGLATPVARRRKK